MSVCLVCLIVEAEKRTRLTASSIMPIYSLPFVRKGSAIPRSVSLGLQVMLSYLERLGLQVVTGGSAGQFITYIRTGAYPLSSHAEVRVIPKKTVKISVLKSMFAKFERTQGSAQTPVPNCLTKLSTPSVPFEDSL